MSDGTCARCGSKLAAEARFCRECGAAVDPTLAGEPAPPARAKCPACAVPAGPDAVFCRSCGERIEPVEAPPPVDLPPPVATAPPPLPPPQPRPERGGRGAPILGAVLVCLLLGAAVAGGAYLYEKRGQGSDQSAETASSPFAERLGGAGNGGGRPATGSRSRSAESGEAAAESEGGEASGFSAGAESLSPLAPGRYVQAGSFRTEAAANEEVDRLRAAGIDVEEIPADEAEELLPGFRVLLVGPVAGARKEKRVLKQLEEADVSGFGRDLTPAGEVTAPAAAGEWAGTFEESHLRGSRRTRTYEVSFDLESGGETGTAAYPDDDCGGTLELVEETGYSLAYRESIEYGDCIDGGVWHLRPHNGELTAVWLHENYELMVDGTALP